LFKNSNGAEHTFKQSAQWTILPLHEFAERLDDNQYKYSSHDYSKATLACKIQLKKGIPSTKQFIRIFSPAKLPDGQELHFGCQTNFGPVIGALKGTTT